MLAGSIGVGEIDGVSVMVGESVIVDVRVIVGVIVMVGVSVIVEVGGKYLYKIGSPNWLTKAASKPNTRASIMYRQPLLMNSLRF